MFTTFQWICDKLHGQCEWKQQLWVGDFISVRNSTFLEVSQRTSLYIVRKTCLTLDYKTLERFAETEEEIRRGIYRGISELASSRAAVVSSESPPQVRLMPTHTWHPGNTTGL